MNSIRQILHPRAPLLHTFFTVSSWNSVSNGIPRNNRIRIMDSPSASKSLLSTSSLQSSRGKPSLNTFKKHLKKTTKFWSIDSFYSLHSWRNGFLCLRKSICLRIFRTGLNGSRHGFKWNVTLTGSFKDVHVDRGFLAVAVPQTGRKIWILWGRNVLPSTKPTAAAPSKGKR